MARGAMRQFLPPPPLGFFSHTKYAKISKNTLRSWLFNPNFTKIYIDIFLKNVFRTFLREKRNLEGEERMSCYDKHRVGLDVHDVTKNNA
jgi:hypothetical protein